MPVGVGGGATTGGAAEPEPGAAGVLSSRCTSISGAVRSSTQSQPGSPHRWTGMGDIDTMGCRLSSAVIPRLPTAGCSLVTSAAARCAAVPRVRSEGTGARPLWRLSGRSDCLLRSTSRRSNIDHPCEFGCAITMPRGPAATNRDAHRPGAMIVARSGNGYERPHRDHFLEKIFASCQPKRPLRRVTH